MAKDCEFHGYDDEMILDRSLSTCDDEILQDEALSKDWDLKKFMKHAIMQQDIKAQTEDMKSEIKIERSIIRIHTSCIKERNVKNHQDKRYIRSKTPRTQH